MLFMSHKKNIKTYKMPIYVYHLKNVKNKKQEIHTIHPRMSVTDFTNPPGHAPWKEWALLQDIIDLHVSTT